MSDLIADDVALSIEQQWRRWLRRYAWHLDQIPAILEAMQASVVPLGAVDYGRVRVDVSRDGVPVPFRVESVDSIDALWAAFVGYAETVAGHLAEDLPPVTVWRDPASGVVTGARSSTDLRTEAFALVRWLVERSEEIVPLTVLDDVEELLFDAIRRHAQRYLSPRRERRARCKVCGGAVSARWTAAGEVVECSDCGHVVARPVQPPMSVPCAAADHEGCESLECRCSCHGVRRASLYTARKPTEPQAIALHIPPMSERCEHAEYRGYRDDAGAWCCGGCGAVLGGVSPRA